MPVRASRLEGNNRDVGSDALLRVALVAPGWPPAEFRKGIVTFAVNIEAALTRNGARVFVLAEDQRGREQWDGVIPLGGLDGDRKRRGRFVNKVFW